MNASLSIVPTLCRVSRVCRASVVYEQSAVCAQGPAGVHTVHCTALHTVYCTALHCTLLSEAIKAATTLDGTQMTIKNWLCAPLPIRIAFQPGAAHYIVEVIIVLVTVYWTRN